MQAVLGTLPPGTVLQRRYRIERLLGQGGMGAVYLAEHLALGDWLAVKEMREDLLDPGERPQAVAQFQAEARTLARLRHPNLPRVLDHFSENGRWYLVLDYVEGLTLEQVQIATGGGPLPEGQVLDWAAQLCDVLAYLHSQNSPLIFRDLKPANVMVDGQGRIKLIDFGIARFFHPAKGTDTLKMGTVGYAPPEQYAGRGQTTPRSDLYALGATLHQLLTGSDPSATPFAFTPPRALNPRLSPQVSEAVIKALSLDPAARFASAGEMKQALLAGANGKVAPAKGWTTWQKVLTSLLALATLLAIVGLGAVVVYNLMGRKVTPTPTQVVAFPTATIGLASPSLAAMRSPTSMSPPVAAVTTQLPTPRHPTSTAIPGDTPQPTATPIVRLTSPSPTSPGRRSPTPTPKPSAPPAPILLKPEPGVILSSKRRFEWQWNHPELPPDQAFDLLIWSEEEKDLPRGQRRGAISPWQETYADVEVSEVTTVKEHGEGTYYWTVIVVHKAPYKRIGRWGEERSFVYSYPVPPPDTPVPPTDTPAPPTDTPVPPTETPKPPKPPGATPTPNPNPGAQ